MVFSFDAAQARRDSAPSGNPVVPASKKADCVQSSLARMQSPPNLVPISHGQPSVQFQFVIPQRAV